MDVYSLEPNEDDISKFMLDDLQLAAELGKTLLERNRELENDLKQLQSTIDDQAQEIEYLQKSKTALEEVNQARLNFYEKLEDGISKMERDHQQLVIDHNNEKKSNKALKRTIEQLEGKIEELHKNLNEAQKNLVSEKRKNERLEKEKFSEENSVLKTNLRTPEIPFDENLQDSVDGFIPNISANDSYSFAFESYKSPKANSTGLSPADLNGSVGENSSEPDEELLRVVGDLEKALQNEKERVIELEDQLGEIIGENKTLQGRIAQTSTNEHYKSVHDELSSLDEVRQGQMCSRCLRQVQDQYEFDETASIAPTEDDDDLVDSASAVNASRSEHIAQASIKESRKSPPNTLNIGGGEEANSPNPYKDLVDKYEALLEVQRQSNPRRRGSGAMIVSSLEEEVKAGKNSEQIEKQDKEERVCGRDALSEAETSSSGYSDETSSKGTQTDAAPGYFLCSIGNGDVDGEDCKFSIYDDSSQTIDSRFRNRPEYRELFKEIFAVLKKAADNKAEGEKLPLLDDEQQEKEIKEVFSVPPVTPAVENIPEPSEIDCDSQSIISSAISEQSFAMSECITKLERKTAKKQHAAVVAAQSTQQLCDPSGKTLVPLKREPLDYLTTGFKKRNRNRKNRNEGRSESPNKSLSPRHSSGKKRREYKPFDFQMTPSPLATPPNSNREPLSANQGWDGSSLIIYNKRSYKQADDSTPRTSHVREVDMTSVQYRPSTLFQDFHKLKKLDMSYAEVLRKASSNDSHHHYYQYQCQMQNVTGSPGVGNSQGHKKTPRSNNFYQQQRQQKSHHHYNQQQQQQQNQQPRN